MNAVDRILRAIMNPPGHKVRTRNTTPDPVREAAAVAKRQRRAERRFREKANGGWR